MKRNAGVVLPFLLVALNTSAVLAQQNQFTVFGAAHGGTVTPLQLSKHAQEEPMRPQDAMSISGMFLGVVGMMGGAAIASAVKQDDCNDSEDDACLARYAFTGALIAGTAMVPIGVHIANKKRKHLLTTLAVSTLTGAAIYFGTRAIPGEPVHIAPFLAAPVQMITSIKIELRK